MVRMLLSKITLHRKKQQYVFGHFLAAKYMRLTLRGWRKNPQHQYITFVREPLARAISNYYYWKQIRHRKHRIWVRCSEEKWSLEQFLLYPGYANFQAQFLYGLDVNAFDFVGVVEHLELSLHLLGQQYPAFSNMAPLQLNRTERKDQTAIEALDRTVVEQFSKLHAVDYAIYASALRRIGVASEP
jgi:hypothetical protein